MASVISAGTTSGTALNFSGDTTGNLELKTQAGANTITVPNSTGTIALTSQLPVTGPSFSAYQSNAQTISQNVQTKITFTSTDWNVGSAYSTANSQFTPLVAGYYQITASIASQNAGGGAVEIAIFKNGSSYKNGFSINATGLFRSQMTCMVYMNGTTDYLEVYWYQNSSSGSRNTVTGSVDTYFQGFLARAA